MDIVLIVLAVGCFLVGIAGSILPALPGPPLSYLGMLAGLLLGAFAGFILGTGVKLLYCFFAMASPFFYGG
jgi:uncharacterized protein YqgC (DUF456 family)